MKFKKSGFVYLIGIFVILILSTIMIINSALVKDPDYNVIADSNVTLIEDSWIVSNDSNPTQSIVSFKNQSSHKLNFEGGVHYTFNQVIAAEYVNDTIVFESNRTRVWVYLDNTLVYSFDPDLPSFSLTPPSKWNIVDLPNAHAGSNLEVVMESDVTVNNVQVYAFYSAAHEDAVTYVMRKGTLSLIVSVAIFAISLVILSLWIASRKKELAGLTFLYLSIATAIFSLFSVAENSVPELYFGSLAIWDMVKYVSIAAAACFFSLSFMREYAPQLNEDTKGAKTLRLCVNLTFWLAIVSFVAQVAMQFIGIDLAFSSVINLPVYLIIFIVTLIVAIYLYIKEKTPSNLYRAIVKFIAVELLFVAMVIMIGSYTHLANQFFRIGILCYAIGTVGHLIHQLFADAKKRQALAEELSTIKANAIAHQIRPEFLISALDDIKTITMVTPNRASDSLDSYSIYLTSNLKTLTKRPYIKFSQELEHIKSYLDIIQFKNGNKIKVVYDVIDQTFLVPPVTIELFVENAIRNSILKKMTGGQIEISAWADDDNFYIEITDDGKGYDISQLDDRYGILTAKQRLEKDCQATVSIRSGVNEMTTVMITIPKAYNFSLRREQRKP